MDDLTPLPEVVTRLVTMIFWLFIVGLGMLALAVIAAGLIRMGRSRLIEHILGK